jgi:hypothetical protein
MAKVLETWRSAFLDQIQQTWVAEDLKRAALAEDLTSWTTYLTTAVVKSCEPLGWDAAAKWNPSKRLPQHGKEYLSIDVMAFPPVRAGQTVLWPPPIAVFELENHRTDQRVAYSLWKVLCVRAALRVVIAYRPDWEQSRSLVTALGRDVIGSLSTEQRTGMDGQIVVIVGNRGDGETFPWGYFKFWLLDNNLGRFDKV